MQQETYLSFISANPNQSMKTIFLTSILILQSIFCFSQGSNNDYPIDDEDLVNIFEQQGIHMFKYPLKINKGGYLTMQLDVYENGDLTKTINTKDEAEKVFGGKIDSYISSTKDTIEYLRVYFFEQEESIFVKLVSPGLSSPLKIKRPLFDSFSSNSRILESSEVNGQTELAFFYGNKSEEIPCSSGLPTNKIIERYDFVMIVSVIPKRE